jgi:hypothetical protein
MNPDNFFKSNGYLYVKNIIDVGDLFSHLDTLAKNGKGKIDDLIKGCRTFYKEDKCEQLLQNLLPKMELLTGIKLYKVYSFARIYETGQILRAHKDRESCEITVTICLGHVGDPWPISLLDNEEKAHSFLLAPGDGLIFRGGEHLHWREKNHFGSTTNVLLHYVDQEGRFAGHRDDKNNLKFGFSIPLFNSSLRFRFEKVRTKGRKNQV